MKYFQLFIITTFLLLALFLNFKPFTDFVMIFLWAVMLLGLIIAAISTFSTLLNHPPNKQEGKFYKIIKKFSQVINISLLIILGAPFTAFFYLVTIFLLTLSIKKEQQDLTIKTD